MTSPGPQRISGDEVKAATTGEDVHELQFPMEEPATFRYFAHERETGQFFTKMRS